MLLETDDPFEFITLQKTARGSIKNQQTNIKINVNKLPPDFFPHKRPIRLKSHTQKLPLPHEN
jgi:hypothetical protein